MTRKKIIVAFPREITGWILSNEVEMTKEKYEKLKKKIKNIAKKRRK